MGTQLLVGGGILSPHMHGVAKILAANLDRIMVERDMTQDELSRLTGRAVSQKTISNILRGNPPIMSVVESIAKALGVQPWRLMIDPESETARYIDRVMSLSPGSRDFVEQVIEREIAGNKSR